MLEGITSFCGVANLWMVELIRTQLRKLEPDPSETITTKLRAGAARISLRNIVISQKSTFQGIRLNNQLLKSIKWRIFKLAFSPQINSSLTRTFIGWRRKHLEVMNGLDWFLESSVSHRPLIMAAPKGSQCIKRIPRWRECANHQFASKYYFFQFSTTQHLRFNTNIKGRRNLETRS